MKKYDLVKRTAEIKYKDRKEIEEGYTGGSEKGTCKT